MKIGADKMQTMIEIHTVNQRCPEHLYNKTVQSSNACNCTCSIFSSFVIITYIYKSFLDFVVFQSYTLIIKVQYRQKMKIQTSKQKNKS